MTIEQDKRLEELLRLLNKTAKQIDELSELMNIKALEILQKSMNIQHPDSRKKDYPDTWFDHLEHEEEDMITMAMMDYTNWILDHLLSL